MVPKKSLISKSPTISVIMPAYNAEKYISESIESILNQTHKNFELIIIDDCSKDKSWNIIQKYAKKNKIIHAIKNEKNLGLCLTLNKGIKYAKGKYIARADNDDWYYPERLEKQYLFLESNPDVGIVGGTMEIMSETGEVYSRRTYSKTDQEIRKHIFSYSPFSHPLVMIKKSILNKTGNYNSSFIPADDYELYFRIGKYSKFANLSDTLMKYRVSSASMTSKQTKKMEHATIKVRNFYANTFPYHMNIMDRVYNFLHFISIYLIPHSYKRQLFAILRDRKAGHKYEG